MSKISAADVKKLRDMTGAGMMDCKKALKESNGDIDGAIEFLRKRGQKMADKRADRSASEGAVLAIVSDDRTKGVIVKLGCETDFVAKNESFVELTRQFGEVALNEFPATLEELLACKFEDITIGEKVTEQIAVIGEKLELSAYERVEAAMVAPYIHMGNKAAVLVGMNKSADNFFDAGRSVGMQVAAMKPKALDKNDVPQTIIDKELEIGREQALAEGKPEQIVDKIAQGKLAKYFKENTLLNQQYVKDSSFTVASYLQSLDKELTATAFKHVTLG